MNSRSAISVQKVVIQKYRHSYLVIKPSTYAIMIPSQRAVSISMQLLHWYTPTELALYLYISKRLVSLR